MTIYDDPAQLQNKALTALLRDQKYKSVAKIKMQLYNDYHGNLHITNKITYQLT